MEALDPDSEAAAALASPGKGVSPPKEEEEDEDDFAAQVPPSCLQNSPCDSCAIMHAAAAQAQARAHWRHAKHGCRPALFVHALLVLWETVTRGVLDGDSGGDGRVTCC